GIEARGCKRRMDKRGIAWDSDCPIRRMGAYPCTEKRLRLYLCRRIKKFKILNCIKMKICILMVPLLLLFITVWAQAKPVKIVFDITSKDEAAHQTTMRHLKMMSAAYPDSEFEIVVYGGAFPMVVRDKSTVSEEIK